MPDAADPDPPEARPPTATPSAGKPSAGKPPILAWLAGGDPPEVLAVLWATVDLDRTLTDVRAAGPVVGGAVTTRSTGDPLLGARVVVESRPAAADSGAIAFAEPITEGRLAGTLARHGEGPAGWYLRAPVGIEAVRVQAGAASVVLSRPAVGPFGASVLILGDSPAGPHVILVDPAAVPSRP